MKKEVKTAKVRLFFNRSAFCKNKEKQIVQFIKNNSKKTEG